MKQITDFPNYEIDEFGKVFNKNTGKGLSTFKRNGYVRVSLYKEGKCHKRSVHRLVAEHYVPNPYNLPDVDHDDEDKENNHKSNVKWTTSYDNTVKSVIANKERYDTGRMPKPIKLDDVEYPSLYAAALWLCNKYDKKLDSVRAELRRKKTGNTIYGHVVIKA